MVFVRLAGCSVQKCHIRAECDEAPWKMRERLSVQEIVDRVAKIRPDMFATMIVCVTGGEPTDHDLMPLLSALREDDYRIHMETSGVRSVAGWPLEWLTVSPKTPTFAQKTGHALKVVVRPEQTDDEAWLAIDRLDAHTDFFHRYLQPMTLLGVPANTAQVARMLLSDHNVEGRWALSAQSHRTWGLP
jgi:organic radical activating enzyme